MIVSRGTFLVARLRRMGHTPNSLSKNERMKQETMMNLKKKVFEYDSAIDNLSSDDESSEDEDIQIQSTLDIEDLSHRQYILYRWEYKSFYVGTVSDITSEVTESYEKVCCA